MLEMRRETSAGIALKLISGASGKFTQLTDEARCLGVGERMAPSGKQRFQLRFKGRTAHQVIRHWRHEETAL